MSEGLYELLALCARYVFAGLMVLIVARAWRITIVDSRRAKTLRRISPETGIIGELMVLEGDEKACRGMKYKVIREGQIGSARRADIRVRHSSVRRRHAYFLLTGEGLRIRAHAGAPLRDEQGRIVREIILKDGDSIDVGRVRLMLILSNAPEAGNVSPARRRRGISADSDSGFDTLDDELFTPDGFDEADDLFGGFDTYQPPVRPVRRHLPFSLEDNAASQSRPARTVNQSAARSGESRRTNPAHVQDNPLNRRRPRSAADISNLNDNDEMW